MDEEKAEDKAIKKGLKADDTSACTKEGKHTNQNPLHKLHRF